MHAIRSLRAQLALAFLGFVLLTAASIGSTLAATRDQASDAVLINLAGRQRMLTQRMIWLSLSQPGSAELADAIQLFDQTLAALRDGGSTLNLDGQPVTLPPAPDAALRSRLDAVAQSWGSFRSILDRAAPDLLPAESAVLLEQLNAVVAGYEARAQAKLARLQFTQVILFVLALGLLAWGYYLIRYRLIRPLDALGAAARRMAGGSLTESVRVAGGDELSELGRTLERMRAELASAHALLETRVAQRTEELTSAFEFSQEIVAELELKHLLRSVTERARALTHAQASSLCLLNQDHSALILAASDGSPSAALDLRQPVQAHFTQRVISEGETVVTEAACAQCGFLAAHAPGWCAAAPLRTGHTTLGALCVVRQADGPFSGEETRALTLLANSAAIAIRNARLAEAERRQAERAASLAERERLAAELHDHLAQTLSYLHLKTDEARTLIASGHAVQAARTLAAMNTAVQTAHGQVRAALVGLQESAAQAGDLAEKLAASVNEFHADTQLPVQLTIAEAAALGLPPLAQTQALHIVREALANVRQHARARQVWVRLESLGDEALITVQDDGCGFHPQASGQDHHLGLTIMRTRAERSGGRFVVESEPGIGTTITAALPLGPGPLAYARAEAAG